MAALPIIFGAGGLMAYLVSDNITIPNQQLSQKYNLTNIYYPQSLNEETRNILKLITLNENIPNLGSQKYPNFKYPTEINIFENYQSCCDLKIATIDLSSRLSQMGHYILKSNSIYFVNFKAGLDSRYNLDLGEFNSNYNKQSMMNQIISLHNRNLLDDIEYLNLVTLINQSMNFNKYEKIKSIIQNKKIIKWKLQELINGIKILPGNKKLFLQDAIAHKSIIKLEIIALVNQRFIKFNTFFLLTYLDTYGHLNRLNMNLKDTINDMVNYYQNKPNHLISLTQRLWQSALYSHNDTLLIQLTPLFQSNIGILNQISEDIKILIFMLKKIFNPKKIPWTSIVSEIEQFKYRLNDYQLKPSINRQLIFLLIDEIKNNYELYGNQINKLSVIKNLNYIGNYLSKIVNRYVINYLKHHDLDINQFS